MKPYLTNGGGNIIDECITLNTTGKKRDTYWKTGAHYGRCKHQQITVEIEDGTPMKG
jgi:hypothetical protein